jgi:hypothetical protein
MTLSCGLPVIRVLGRVSVVVRLNNILMTEAPEEGMFSHCFPLIVSCGLNRHFPRFCRLPTSPRLYAGLDWRGVRLLVKSDQARRPGKIVALFF